MPRALVALGTNLGDRHAMLARAIERVTALAADGTLQISAPVETVPAGGPAGQEAFLNAAASFETSLSPTALLASLRAIEEALGRVRGERWGARLIDLDILLYDDEPGKPRIVADAELLIPHPRMAFRRFALEPAVEVAPEMVHPVFDRTVEQLLDHLNHAAPYLAILGGTAAERNALAQAVAEQTGAKCILDPAPERDLRPEDSSGRSKAGPLQFPRLREFAGHTAQLLSQHDWQSGEWVVSAGSALQAMAEEIATGRLTPSDFQPAIFDTIPAPRLIVLLDDWSELVAMRLGDRPRPGESVRQTALFAAMTSGVPVLCAGRNDMQAQLTEITAAIVAM